MRMRTYLSKMTCLQSEVNLEEIKLKNTITYYFDNNDLNLHKYPSILTIIIQIYAYISPF